MLLLACLDRPAFGSKAKGCCLLPFEKYLLIPISGPLHIQKHLFLFRVNPKYHLLHEALPDSPPTKQNLPFLCSSSPGLNHIPAPVSPRGPQLPSSACTAHIPAHNRCSVMHRGAQGNESLQNSDSFTISFIPQVKPTCPLQGRKLRTREETRDRPRLQSTTGHTQASNPGDLAPNAPLSGGKAGSRP